MPFVYFGYPPKKGASKTTVTTQYGEIEPIEPSRVKVYAQSVFAPVFALAASVLGLLVAISSFPAGFFTTLSVEGILYNPVESDLPFANPSLACPIVKGKSVSDRVNQDLERRGFTRMAFAGRTIYIKDLPEDSDFTFVSTIPEKDTKGQTPARTLNVDAFESWLTLRTITYLTARFFSQITAEGGFGRPLSKTDNEVNAPEIDNWVQVTDDLDNPTLPRPQTDFVFKKVKAYMYTAAERFLGVMLRYAGSSESLGRKNSAVVVSPLINFSRPSFLRAGDSESIVSNGLIFRFNHEAALPDVNLIGDVIGKYLLAGLGFTYIEQIENLQSLKSGLSSLKLTRLGDELTHFWKCIEIAIQLQCGCVPFFTNSVYEGCVLAGGIGGRVSIGNITYPFLDVLDLKQEFLNVSSHDRALSLISGYFREDVRAMIRGCKSMWMLRGFCLVNPVTEDDRQAIVRHAAHLDFGNDPWVLNPNNLKRFALLLQNLSNGNVKTPISRLCLFSRDPVMIALSCFGEKSVPSWDIPGGIECSWAKTSPPSPLAVPNRKGKGPATISDAAWVMVIRRTDLESGTTEFRHMADTLKYRSVSSVDAHRVGHQVYKQDRMMEFWTEMKGALQAVNPKAQLDQETELRGTKRSRDSSATVEGPIRRRRGMGFVAAGQGVREPVVVEEDLRMEEGAEEGEILDEEAEL